MKTFAPQPTRSLVTQRIDFVPTLSKGQQEALKWLAIITMTIDHVNKLIFNFEYPFMLWIGRLAFPLFAFLIAYNLVVREVKPTRYLWPLLLFAIGTQPIAMWAWAGQPVLGNILFTLYLGVLYVGLYPILSQRLPNAVAHLLLVLILFLPSLQVEYGPVGAFFIPVLVYFLKQPTPLTYLWLSIYLIAVNALATSEKIIAFFVSPVHGLYLTLSTLEPLAFVPLLLFPLIFFISRLSINLIRSNPWLFYLFYPAHLLILKFIGSYLS
jgi:TraX protein